MTANGCKYYHEINGLEEVLLDANNNGKDWIVIRDPDGKNNYYNLNHIESIREVGQGGVYVKSE